MGGSVYNNVHWVKAYSVDIDSNMELAMTLPDSTSQTYLTCASDSQHDQILVIPDGAYD